MVNFLPDPTFYPSPRDAMAAPPEDLAYVAGIYTGTGIEKPDFLSVIDLDPKSQTYGKFAGRLDFAVGEELHHFGWNACSSALCPYAKPQIERRYLIIPGLRSSNIYVADIKPDPRKPAIVKTISAQEIAWKAGYSRLHTVHCGPEAIYVSALGGANGRDGPGGVLMLDHYNFNPLGRWEISRGPQQLAYDFSWHIAYDTLVSSEWTTPQYFENGVNIDALVGGKYGNKLHFWDLIKRRHTQEVELSQEDRMVLELRPFHNPTEQKGFVNTVVNTKNLSSAIWFWSKEEGKFRAEKVIELDAKPAEQGDLPDALKPFKAVPPLVTDIDLSLDDRWLYVSLWGIGEIRRYDVGNPLQPRLTGTVKLGGIFNRADHPNGHRLTGGPQMVEVSRDGRRVYVTNGLYSSWDNQFYPQGMKGWFVKLDASPDGSFSIDGNFLVDFGDARAHQTRLKGGDASSDTYCFP